MSSEVPGIDTPKVTSWFEQSVPGARGPFHFRVIAGGHSNLTFLVTGSDGTRYVLRRPPLGHVLESAHDMGREHRIISGLANTAVPVAPALGFCSDTSVNGAPFYVMAYVDGLVVHNQEEALRMLTPEARANASRSLVDTMAAIHSVDLKACGLDNLGKHEDYIARQMRRWYGQWNQQKTRELAAVDEAHAILSTRIPEQGPATIVHGDYRLDNCMVDAAGNVIAVLDWEICTLGDPLADLGLLQVYWTGPGDAQSAWAVTGTTAPGFWNRDDTLRRYAEVSGRDLSQIDFYIAFAYWKLACILEGVYARYLGGALGDHAADEVHTFKVQVDASAAQALEYAQRMK